MRSALVFISAGLVVGFAGSLPSAVAAPDSSPGMTLDVCPDSYGGFNGESPPLTCGCSSEAAKRGNIRGANPYTFESSICRAALHAGVIGANGGQVIVTPENAPVFPGVTRNGVSSNAWEKGWGFRVASAVSPQPAKPSTPVSHDESAGDSVGRGPRSGGPGDGLVDASGRPIQAPIAETLRAAGKVQVYVNFVTDSAQLQPSSDAVLNELLKTLKDSPELRVDLVGHTDSTASAAHNQDLSERRAASLYLWLVQHGIARERLRSSGRGFLEPIATNDTDAGRALNRRVEVKSLNSKAEAGG
jgi:outer membrane protein OmpA-like peptidoglycan-associated protein